MRKKSDTEEYFMRTAGDLYRSAYTEGYSDGLSYGKEQYGQRGIAHCHIATQEQIETWGPELWGWCDCGRAIEGRWVGIANFCPWCGKIIEWEKRGE